MAKVVSLISLQFHWGLTFVIQIKRNNKEIVIYFYTIYATLQITV